MSQVNVQEVFGQFAVNINGSVKLFDTRSEAEAAGVLAENAAEFQAQAEAYCAARGLEGKVAVGKSNVIIDFLAFQASESEAEAE